MALADWQGSFRTAHTRSLIRVLPVRVIIQILAFPTVNSKADLKAPEAEYSEFFLVEHYRVHFSRNGSYRFVVVVNVFTCTIKP